MAENNQSGVPKTNQAPPGKPIQNNPVPVTTTEKQLPSTPVKVDPPSPPQVPPTDTPIQNTPIPVTTTEKQLPSTPVKANEKI